VRYSLYIFSPLIVIVVYISGYFTVHAQISNISIVSTYTIVDESYENGDIISHNQNLNTYALSKVAGDEGLFGVIQDSPVVVFRSEDGDVPIVELGEVFVNVTTIEGPIQVGDLVTSSAIPGKGQRFTGDEGKILGIALQPFSLENNESIITYAGEEIAVGNIVVLLRIGDNTEGFIQVPAPAIIVNEEPVKGIGIGTLLRYLLAVLFAITSLYLIFKKLGPNLRQGVISVGRNPLAKSTIQAMVTFNILLILVISIASLLISFAIIILPL
jgi:hypothetical protein